MRKSDKFGFTGVVLIIIGISLMIASSLKKDDFFRNTTTTTITIFLIVFGILFGLVLLMYAAELEKHE